MDDQHARSAAAGVLDVHALLKSCMYTGINVVALLQDDREAGFTVLQLRPIIVELHAQ